ncbi:glycoside hydrolase family 16 protein [Peniophora sp. CONT]|nr:glycoside hydrolase family 16 protein [Peniophora sp. CONT]
MSTRILAVAALASTSALAATPLKLAGNFAGNDFFSGFRVNSSSIDTNNQGNIHYVDSNTAMSGSSPLAFVNSAGNVILRADNTTNDPNPGPESTFGRNTVMMISNSPIDIGTLVVANLAHIPFGCSVWPAFWTLDASTQSDVGGEIDIIETVNLVTQNQYSLHTRSGCTLSNSSSFPHSGTELQTNCDGVDFNVTGNQGCVIEEPAQNSVGQNFAGGAYALYWSTNGIQIWFFPTASIPSDLQNNSPDPTSWPTPSASYPADTCDPNTFFVPQEIIFDIDICGVFAGAPAVFNATCPNMGSCTDLIGTASNYNNAYWEINYVKTFTATGASANTTASASGAGASSTGGSSSSSGNGSGAAALELGSKGIFAVVGTMLAGAVALVL